MKKSTAPPTDPTVIAIVHRIGRTWRCLIGSLKGSQPAIVAAREFPDDRAARLDEWLDQNMAGAVLCVLPSAAVICRNCPLPDASPDQLQQALQLQAEAHLLGIAPPYRVAMAVLPHAAGETSRTGLVLAWPDAASFNPPPTTRQLTFVPDVAALAALMNGHRPDEAVLWLDRNDGSVALAVSHPGGVMFRATREEADSSEGWQRSISRIVAETALSVGHSGAFVEAQARAVQIKAQSLSARDARLFLPADLQSAAQSRVQGASSDQSWWSQYGIAVGALLARAGQLAPLTRILDAPPVEQPTRLGAIVARLSQPRNAALVTLACVLILMIGPLLFSFLRLQVLKVRYGDIHQTLLAARQARHELAMYEELERQKVWPMTKLLADIAANTPLGIEYDMIRIEAGKDFAVSGTALPTGGLSQAQIVAQMQEFLGRDGMFSDIAVTAGKTDNLGRYKFDLTAKITRPYQIVQYDEQRDFVAKPYRVRKYGDLLAQSEGTPGASGATADATSDSGSEALAQAPAQDNRRTNTITRPQGDVASAEAGDEAPDDAVDEQQRIASMPNRNYDARQVGAGPGMEGDDAFKVNPGAVPPPITTEQAAAMSKEELRDALAKIARARMNKDLADDVKQRLRDEQNMIMEHLRKAPDR